MKLLLTGCTGFIGRELIPLLIKEGHSLTVISRQSKGKLKDILEGKIGDGGKREEKNNRIGNYYSIKSINTFNFY